MGGLGIDARNKFEVLANASVTIGGGTNMGNVHIGDSGELTFGASKDLMIRHNGSHSQIRDLGTGSLKLSGSQIELNNSNNTKNGLVVVEDGAVEAYHNNSKKLETTSGGIEVTGTITIGSAGISEAELEILDGATVTTTELNKLDGVTASTTELNYVDVTTLGTVQASKAVTADSDGNVNFPDDEELKFGDSGDLRIFHNGSHSIIKDGGTGDLELDGSIVKIRNAGRTEDMLIATQNDAVKVYFNNVEKARTAVTGFDVFGNANVSSNVLVGGNVVVTGDAVAAHYHGDGGLLSNVAAATANPATSLASDTDFGTLTSANTTAATDAFTVVISDAIDAFDLLTEPARAQETLNLGAF